MTQRYDMHALRKIQKLEDDFRQKLADIYDCDADDVPVDLDTLSVYNQEPDLRKGTLVCIKIYYIFVLLFLSIME